MAWGEIMSSGRWRGRYYDQDGNPQSVIDGKRGFKYKKDAVEAAEDEAVKARRRAAIDEGSQSARIPWGQLWELFVDTRAKDTETALTERRLVDLHVYPKWGKVPVNQIKRKKVQAWITNEVVPGKKPSYVHKIYQAFAAPLSWAVDEDILDVSPCTKITLPVVIDEPKPYFDDDYIPSLGEYLSEKTRQVCEFQYETGLRPGELCGLHIHRIDGRRKRIYVADVYVSRLRIIRSSPKNQKIREVPLTTKACEILDRVLAGRDDERGCGLRHSDGKKCPSDVVFRTARDVPLNPLNYYALLSRAAERAGVELKSPYAGRRGTATKAKEAGLDIIDIAALLGHDPRETPGYVQQTPAFHGRIRAALGDSPQLTVVEGRGARGAHRGAEAAQQESSAVVPEGGENTG